ncbi:MAG: ribonuclease P protein component [Desulfarculus sp.]|nr:ribonuclease P protein component [Pseudomonadota bacterium]MBV1715045.1 ribonuclease P protein component [Desulfarculus sp.]MBU4575123.1 ribonuclease P protein component [Pseudomonadota bacterium]MBU4599682.1 ribonuclease P protein component [Pseudomonadota bacterium]MBV1739911.1 ribonuclease P protein component [Desulfarculus sp.]
MTGRDFSLPKSARLRTRPQYLAVQGDAKRRRSRHFTLLWRPNGQAQSRLGITVTRRVSGAVGRNRVKRLVREAFRHFRTQLPPGLDLVVVAAPGAPDLGLSQVRQELWELCQSLKTPDPPA